MTGFFKINTFDIFTKYGMMAQNGLYDALLKLPSCEYGLANDWPLENGTERDLSSAVFQPRQISLDFYMYATREYDLYNNYNVLKNTLTAGSGFTFSVMQMSRAFKLKYVSMPSFEKLTKIKSNNKILISFSVVASEEHPDVFLGLNLLPISISYPADSPDVPLTIDVNDFQIINGDLYINETGVFGDNNYYKINGNEIAVNYGLYARKGLYRELLRLPEIKSPGLNYYRSRAVTLPFFLIADNLAGFYAKYYSLAALLFSGNYIRFDAAGMNRRYELCYSDMPLFKKLTNINGSSKVVAELSMTFFDDRPLTTEGAGILDGIFDFQNGQLIYSQSDQFDGVLDFEINNNGELIIHTQ
ncbi:MAG: hypothetical protein AAGB30_10950 [Pedobacter sp.]